MDEHTPGIKLVHPDRSSTHRTIDTFVDDTNSGLTQEALQTFHPPEQSPVSKHGTVYAQTKANVQFYNDLLTSSGGKLAFHKSYAYILITDWKKGARQYQNTHQHLQPISITQNNN